MAFTLGLASFWFVDGSFNGLLEPRIDLPKMETGEVLVVFPRYACELSIDQSGGGGGCGRRRLGNELAVDYKSPESLLKECVEKLRKRGITIKRFR